MTAIHLFNHIRRCGFRAAAISGCHSPPVSWRQLALLCVSATLFGCSILPVPDNNVAVPASTQVNFEGERGLVSKTRSDAIISSLQGVLTTSDILNKHLANEQAINAGAPLVLGNKLTLLEDGPHTYRAMFAAIKAANNHINLETYIMDDDEVGRNFSDLLLRKQSEGVQVNLIYDSFGCLNTPRSFFERLIKGGIQVLEFNPVNPLEIGDKEWLLNNRDHRKLLIIDGRTAFVGGVNISKVYSSNPFSRRSRNKTKNKLVGWRDIHLQIEGPVVAEFQALFLDTWARQEGPSLAPKLYYPELNFQGDEIVRAIGSTPTDDGNPIYLTLISAINQAELNVNLTIAYFAPDPQLIKALIDAAERGVDVKLILPSHSDSLVVLQLGRSYYKTLLEGGVEIFERRVAVMHSKTASIDEVWSTVGSTNLDWRSFLHNDEVNAVILGRNFAAQMAAMFAKDLAESVEIELAQWRKRSIFQRLQERFARLGAYWL